MNTVKYTQNVPYRAGTEPDSQTYVILFIRQDHVPTVPVGTYFKWIQLRVNSMHKNTAFKEKTTT